MLGDLIEALIEAKGKAAQEKALKALERVGMDRHTAFVLAKEMIRERKGENR